MIFSSKNQKRLHTIAKKQTPKSHLSSMCEKTYYSQCGTGNKRAYGQKPLISFTSFQNYLEDCNQREFLKKENEKFYRSNNHAKTQGYFNFEREKSYSSQLKSQNLKSLNYQEEISESICPLTNNQLNQNNNQQHNKRNLSCKSESKNYLFQNEQIGQSFLNEKLGTIQGWSSELKHTQKSRTFVSSRNILQERKLNSTKNRVLKCSQNPLRNNQNIKSTTQPEQKQQLKKVQRAKNKSNKQNIQARLTKPNQQDLFRPIQISYKQKTVHNPLTQINQLEEQILLSKRSQKLHDSLSNPLKVQHTFVQSQIAKPKQISLIQMLKKEFQYLCTEDPQSQIQSFVSIKNNKSFVRFPNPQNKENEVTYKLDQPYQSSEKVRPKTTKFHWERESAAISKILWSANKCNSTQKNSYQAKKRARQSKNITKLSTPRNNKSEDMRSISQQRQRFHLSLKEQKRQTTRQSCLSSTFQLTDSIQYHQSNLKQDPNESLEKLNILSQQLKKSEKFPWSSKQLNSNKRMISCNRAIKGNNRNKIFSSLKYERKNMIENLTITQLEGRHIQKLRKKFDFEYK